MNTHPTATLHMANGSKIVIELLPEAAPNTVNSFIYAASRGFMDHHAIQRIVPGNWVDVTYQAFGHKECQYLIPNEFELHPEIEPLDSHPGCVCMGGYGEDGLASCEFFFPLRDCPDHKGIYPVFGKVIEGMDEIRRLEKVKTRPVDFPIPGVEVNEPVEPEVIEKVELDLKGQTYPEPSPYDRLILDKHVRFIGDPVAIVAGADERCVDKAMKLIKTEYEVLEPLLDFTKAKDNEILVHPEDNWEALCPVGADNKRNLCAHDESDIGYNGGRNREQIRRGN